MGYSAFTPMRSAKARDQMVAFLKEHFRPWYMIQPPADQLDHFHACSESEDSDWTQYIRVGGDLSYNAGPLKVGFDFSSSMGAIGHYGKTLLSWMALRVGQHRKVSKTEYGFVKGTVPVWQYDYDPASPVLIRSEWEDRVPKDFQWVLVDEHGFKPMRRLWYPPGVWALGDPILTRLTVPSLDAKQKQGLRKFFKKQLGVDISDEDLNEVPLQILGDCLHLEWTRDWLKEQKIPYTETGGPFTLQGWRKKQDDDSESALRACDAVISTEMQRLSALWEAREGI